MNDEASGIMVEVAYAKPDSQRIVRLTVPVGTTLIEAVRRSGIGEIFPEIDLEVATFPNTPKAKRAERAQAQKGKA